MTEECWLCAPSKGTEIVYTDVLGMKWCDYHYEADYLGSWSADE